MLSVRAIVLTLSASVLYSACMFIPGKPTYEKPATFLYTSIGSHGPYVLYFM